MNPDDHVCLCFQVSLRKLVNYMNRTEPEVPSQLSDCLGAGTGCHWCVPFLRKLHAQWQDGQDPHLGVSPANYAKCREAYKQTGERDDPTKPGGSVTPRPD